MKHCISRTLLNGTFFALLITLFFACKKEDGDNSTDTDTDSNEVFWLYSRIGSYPDQTDLIAEVTRENLENPQYTFTLLGNGAEVQQKITYGQAFRNGYYYCVSKDQRFGKYRVKDGQLIAELEVPYANLYNDFSYAFKDDNTLSIFGTNGDGDKLVYSEINTNTLAMVNGELDLPAYPAGFDRVRALDAIYRDGKVFLGYQYYNNTTYNVHPGVKVLLLDPASGYKVDKVITDSRSDGFGGIYGGRFQPDIFKDKNGDIYVTSGLGNNTGNKYNYILRIKNGETAFDPNYEVYKSDTYASAGIWDLGNGKALFRTKNSDWIQTYNTIDLTTGEMTKLDIPETPSGADADVAIDQASGKVYIVATPDITVNNSIYIYSISTGALSRGMILPPGYKNILRLDYVGKSK